MGDVTIMLWWLPPLLVTLGAMAWVSWAGRARDEAPDRSDAAQARLAAAMRRELPEGVRRPAARPRERSTGIAVRPSQRPAQGPVQGQAARHPADDQRRSA